jgi:GNAT superfamily N-acetyltransferase
MPFATRVYRLGKRLVGAMPAWLIRFRPFVVYEIPLQAGAVRTSPEAEPRDPCAVQVRWLSDAAELAALPPLASRACLDDWDGATRRVATAELEGRVIGCAWIATGAFEERELSLRFELGPDETWLYAASVAPPLRNRGVYRQLLEFIIAELAAAGRRRLLLGVTVGNEPSLRAHARQGAVEVGRVTALRALGVPMCRCSGQIHRLPRNPGDLLVLVRLAVQTSLTGDR